ncbi:phospholipid scramblase 1 isoform X2 [Cephus cinctus]|nr:phospholipid scramblase 1 isoform X2 [Cephus cinctus]XP_024937267.1 phospholipid scramblase 1 isoform X2 [Cephus cinctus]XP_024937268.1 phospholipid scramblase 1 isoform X2 [Cephus cinctus]XP_024937269.1 phospholipid scramblase 1 isoform X2 [Cephus cinctus]
MPNSNCPTGLECLMTLDMFFVQQQVEILEVITGWDTINKYIVKNASGQVLFLVEEESNFCARCCCGKYRPFIMKITNNTMREVITLCRPFRSSSCLCPCFLQEMEVFVNALKIGTIVQNWNPLRPSFSICNLNGDTVIKIKGPFCRCPFMTVNFKIFSSDGKHEIGRISKQWSGIVQEFFTNADVFGMSFPMDLDVQTKALLLASCLLIDFMYFEGSGKKICL